jgi:AbrB family looped-hinge helix DNA binding protein
MTIHRTRITSDGRIQLPAQLRRELGLNAGDTVDLETHDGQFVVRRPSKGLERIRARLAKYIDPDTDLQAELKAQRVEDAQRG